MLACTKVKDSFYLNVSYLFNVCVLWLILIFVQKNIFIFLFYQNFFKCSTSCGPGISRREVYCKQGRNTISDSLCAKIVKPYETKKCEIIRCPAYQWKVTPWSKVYKFKFLVIIIFKCIDNCKPTEQHRRIYCMSDSNKRAAGRMCSNITMPLVKRNCSINTCPYQWVAGPWSTVY